MTTLGLVHGDRAIPTRSHEDSVRRAFLISGVLSSMLYVATDIIGGLSYPGYSFTSQVVSELMATGSPSERIVDPLFLLSGVFALAFGIGVFLHDPRNRPLRITGAILVAYAVIGQTGPTLFEMNQRGSNTSLGDAAHIAVTVVIVFLLLLAMGIGAHALGRRFRTYSFATLLTVIVFGALTSASAARLAVGQPTPGMGTFERINIYAAMLWIAVLGIALLRRPAVQPEGSRQ
jgi:hypothetical membrane protein